MTEEYIEHPLVTNLADHTDQLNEIYRVVKNLQKKFEQEKRTVPRPTEKNIETIDYVLRKCLRKVADMSMTRNEIESQLKDHYTTTYAKKPALGKKLFLEHYFSLHKPYDKVKNITWKMIFAIDEYKETKF